MTNRFHLNHGSNICLDENQTVAIRNDGYGNGVAFAEKYLHPGELFLVEVEQNDVRWCGSLRLGITQVNPDLFSSSKIEVPEYAQPDLTSVGPSWIYSLSELIPNIEDTSWPCEVDSNKINVSEGKIETCIGSYCGKYSPRSVELPTEKLLLRGVEVGFRVGVMYIPVDRNVAELYYLLNGNVYGPYAEQIPYRNNSLYAVVDVYGRTKKVRILQEQPEQTLKQMCRLTILDNYDYCKMKSTKLPKSIIEYLNFERNII